MFEFVRNYLNLKVILGAILFAGFLFAALVGLLWSSRGEPNLQAPATAILHVIVAPTATLPFPLATPSPSVEPTSSLPVPTPGGEIEVGDYVQVNGTGGDGLRLHINPGVSGDVHYIAIEAEVLLVMDGPQEADGYTWWLLQDPYDANATGWGVANYLAVVQNP
jgi:hypothetical protein